MSGWCVKCAAWSTRVDRVEHDDDAEGFASVDGPALREVCPECGGVWALIVRKAGNVLSLVRTV